MAIVGFFGSFMYFLLAGCDTNSVRDSFVCVFFFFYAYFTQRCNINSVCDSIVCDLYFTQRCVINRVCDSFVCGSVGPNPHALSALTMST